MTTALALRGITCQTKASDITWVGGPIAEPVSASGGGRQPGPDGSQVPRRPRALIDPPTLKDPNAYVIPPDDADQLSAEGFHVEPVGHGIEPPKVIVLAPPQRAWPDWCPTEKCPCHWAASCGALSTSCSSRLTPFRVGELRASDGAWPTERVLEWREGAKVECGWSCSTGCRACAIWYSPAASTLLLSTWKSAVTHDRPSPPNDPPFDRGSAADRRSAGG